jgi:hypothetical protein
MPTCSTAMRNGTVIANLDGQRAGAQPADLVAIVAAARQISGQAESLPLPAGETIEVNEVEVQR